MRRGLLLLALAASACAISDHEDGLEVDVALQHDGTPAGVSRALVALSTIEIVPCAGARHSAGTPTKLGVPVVEDLLAPPGQPRTLGTLAAPPGRYCSVEVTVAPADSDALGLEAAPDMLGVSARFHAGELDARCTSTFRAAVPIEPLEVSEDSRHATLLLSIDAARLLEGVELTPGVDPAVAGCAAAANAAGAVRRVP